jgi:glycolate oxidase iron-sulfur subunit
LQTNFTAEQLADPLVAGAEPILRSCVHYGFCTATCPTYMLFRDENDGPRGRIDLIRNMLERGGRPDDKTVHHLDRCLSCLGCMTTCAVRVDYMHLIDLARIHIEKNYPRPLLDRTARSAIAAVIPFPARMRLAMKLARLAQPLRSILPRQLRALLDMVPPADKEVGGMTEPRTYPAEGQQRRRVALLAGCAQQVLDRNINDATIRLLTRLGCEVVVLRGLGCCGALTLHMGKAEHGKNLAARNLRALRNEHEARGLDALVVNASGCGTAIKDYGHLFEHDGALAASARWLSAITKDVSELVAELALPEPAQARAYRVAYHDACSLRHGQRVSEQPRQLLRRAGYQVVDVPEGHICCGSAGTYNLLQPEIAAELGRRKAAHVASTNADIAAMGNIGCLTQLRRHMDLPAVHTVELLDWATGGPMPMRLRHAGLGAPPARLDARESPQSGNSSGIW